MIFDLMVLQEGHVPGIQPNDPGGHRTWQADIEEAASAGSEPAVTRIARFVPPSRFFPRVSGQRKKMTRWRHAGKIDRDAGAVQVHGRLEHGFEFALAAGRRNHDGFGSASRQTFLGRMRERGMGVEFQPDVNAEFRQRIHRRSKTHRLANAAGPVGGITRFARAALAGHRAEKRDGSRLRFQIGQRLFQSLSGRSHERMMKRMIDPHESRKCALRLELGGDRFERNSRTRERDGTRAVESGNRYCPIVSRDECDGFVLGQSDGKHRSFAASAFFHETRAQRDDAGRFFERKNSGNAGRRNFADAVTNDRGWLNAPRFPERRERHLHGKNAG